MLVTADSRNPVETETDLLVLPLVQIDDKKRALAGRAAALDRALGGRLSSVIESRDFRGKPDEKLLLYPDAAARPGRARFLSSIFASLAAF